MEHKNHVMHASAHLLLDQFFSRFIWLK